MVKHKYNNFYWTCRRWFKCIFNFRSHIYALLTPSNHLKIRNCPRRWVDRDYRLFHACFTLLCDFVEKEHDGAEDWDSYVNWCRVEYFKDPSLFPKRQYEASKVFDRLYKWYRNVDWNGYNYEDSFEESCNENLNILIEYHEQMWT